MSRVFDSPLSASAYDVLGVEPAADEESLRRAYRLRLRQTHPDTGGDAAVFIQVQRAWELVGTVDARAAYDRGPRLRRGARAGVVGLASRRRGRPTRARARGRSGSPAGWRRERYLDLIREWVGPRRDARGPVRPGARALRPASPAPDAGRRARRGGDGARRLRPRHGLHRVARRRRAGARRNRRRQARPHRAEPLGPVRRPVGGLRRAGRRSPRRAHRRCACPARPSPSCSARMRARRARGRRPLRRSDRRAARRGPACRPVTELGRVRGIPVVARRARRARERCCARACRARARSAATRSSTSAPACSRPCASSEVVPPPVCAGLPARRRKVLRSARSSSASRRLDGE